MDKNCIKIEEITTTVAAALDEDIKTGDITSNNLIAADKIVNAKIYAKADGIISGLCVVEYIFRIFDKNLKFTKLVNEGDFVKKGDTVVRFEGKMRALLTGERTALNFLQRMSGIATETNRFVRAVEGTNTKILDTRKTVPGLRVFDKYAVSCGGGTNHRMGLYDLVMIKDNHIKAAGGIKNAVEQIRKNVADDMRIEVETTNLDEVGEAIAAGADIIMLDNMTTPMMAEAVKLVNQRAEVEASGNMSLNRVREVAETGVDFISVGALTHSVTALDLSMLIIDL